MHKTRTTVTSAAFELGRFWLQRYCRLRGVVGRLRPCGFPGAAVGPSGALALGACGVPGGHGVNGGIHNNYWNNVQGWALFEPGFSGTSAPPMGALISGTSK